MRIPSRPICMTGFKRWQRRQVHQWKERAYSGLRNSYKIWAPLLQTYVQLTETKLYEICGLHLNVHVCRLCLCTGWTRFNVNMPLVFKPFKITPISLHKRNVCYMMPNHGVKHIHFSNYVLNISFNEALNNNEVFNLGLGDPVHVGTRCSSTVNQVVR